MSDGFKDVVPVVEQLLGDTFACEIRVAATKCLTSSGRSTDILRCSIVANAMSPSVAGGRPLPRSVIVKRSRLIGSRMAGEKTVERFYGTWVGLRFLNALQATGCPQLYGVSHDHGLIVMEDFGAADSLATVLLEGDSRGAEAALLLFATSLGRLHATTAGRESGYLAIRNERDGGPSGVRRVQDAHDIAVGGGVLRDACTAMGVSLAPGFDADVEHIARAVADPGPFLTYTHGDACPDNNSITETDHGPTLQWFDFDDGAYRHALWDGVFARMRFPTCWCVHNLPESLVDRADAAYRAELAQGCEAAADDFLYARGTADACGGWLLANCKWHLQRALEHDRMWGDASIRQHFLMRIPIFVDAARRAAQVEALADTALRLHAALAARWARVTAPITGYPALSGDTAPPSSVVLELVRAIEGSDLNRVETLLAVYPDLANALSPDERRVPMLLRAVEHNHHRIAALLLERGADWRASACEGPGILVLAAGTASLELVALLLKYGADPNTPGGHGFLPLQSAARARRGDIARLLVQHGARMDPLAAVYLDRRDAAEQLLDQWPHITRARFHDGKTALHEIATFDHAAASYVGLFVAKGAQVDAASHTGATPLHAAAAAGNSETVRALLAAGANPNLRARDGRTPRGIADAQGLLDIAELLRAGEGWAS